MIWIIYCGKKLQEKKKNKIIFYLCLDWLNDAKHTNLQILWVVFSVRVPRWEFFSKHDRKVINKTEQVKASKKIHE